MTFWPFTGEDYLDKIIGFLDGRGFRCAFCDSSVAKAQLATDGDVRGIIFRCHGQNEFMEISDAQLRSRRLRSRLEGYQPFQQAALQAQLNKQQWAAQRIKLPEFLEGWRPTCERCQKPVQATELFRDENRRSNVIRFRCHGAAEDRAFDETETRNPNFKDWLSRIRPFDTSLPIMPYTALTAPAPDDINQARYMLVKAPPPTPPKPKPVAAESLLIPATKPRVITLED